MPIERWGLMPRTDSGETRRTRGLGLGGAARTFNDLAVPGLGGLWFARPLIWSLLGVELAVRTGRSNIEVANAIEALACSLALHRSQRRRDARVRGSNKLRAVPWGFVPYRKARRRSFYVTQPMRQAIVQPLRALGLVTARVQRFNTYRLSGAGRELLQASVSAFKPYNASVQGILEEWILGRGQRVATAPMYEALSPLRPLPAPARALLRERLVVGEGADRREAALRWVSTLTPTDGERPPWSPRPAAIDADHWDDLRAGARFFGARAAALGVLDLVEALLRDRSEPRCALSEASGGPLAAPLARLALRAQAFLDEGRDPSPERCATAFCKRCTQAGPRALGALVALDGRGLRLAGEEVVPGPAFQWQGPGAELLLAPAQGDHQGKRLPLPAGTSGRVGGLYSLHLDLEGRLDSWLVPPEEEA